MSKSTKQSNHNRNHKQSQSIVIDTDTDSDSDSDSDNAANIVNTYRRRTKLPQSAVIILREWFISNIHHPYPTENDKLLLSIACELNYKQVQNWLTNSRRRYWQPRVNKLLQIQNENNYKQ